MRQWSLPRPCQTYWPTTFFLTLSWYCFYHTEDLLIASQTHLSMGIILYHSHSRREWMDPNIDPPVRPIFIRLSIPEVDGLCKRLNKMRARGFIQSSISPYRARALSVWKKPDGTAEALIVILIRVDSSTSNWLAKHSLSLHLPLYENGLLSRYRLQGMLNYALIRLYVVVIMVTLKLITFLMDQLTFLLHFQLWRFKFHLQQ